MAFIVETTEACRWFAAHLNEGLIDCFQASHDLLDILRLRVMQNIDQPLGHHQRLPKGNAPPAELEEYGDRAKHAAQMLEDCSRF